MPYTKPHKRPRYNLLVEEAQRTPPQTPGDLNYCVTMICLAFLEYRGESYDDSLHSISGVLTDAREELRRRVMNPYEDQKISENGDIFPRPYRRT